MGIAIIIPNADFSASGENIGKVNIVQDIPLESIALTASTRIGNNIQVNVGYTPTTTNRKGVTWSLEGADASKFSINQNGLVTILASASNSSVTVKATSTSNSAKVATINLTNLTYQLSLVSPTEIEMADLYDDGTSKVLASSEYDLLGDCKQWTINFACKYKTSGQTRGHSYIKAGTGFSLCINGDSTKSKAYADVAIANSTYWNAQIAAQIGTEKAETSNTQLRVCSKGDDTSVNIVAVRRDYNTFYISVDGGQTWGSFVNSYDFVANSKNGVMELWAPDRNTSMCALQFSTAIDNNSECLAFYNKNKDL